MNNVKSVSLKDPIKLNIKSIKTNNYQNKIEQFNNYEEINYSDLNNDGKLDKNDVDVLSKATDDNFVGPLPQSFDFNGDNKINKDDVNHLNNFINQQNINYSDLNNDGKLDKNDVDVLSKAIDDNFVGPLPQSFDFNGDNKINKDDVDYLNNFINQQDPNYSPEKERIKKKVDSITSFANSEYDKIKNSDFSYGEDEGSKFRKWFDSEYGTGLESGKHDWCAAFITYLMAQNGGIDKYIKPSTFADNLVRDSVKAGYGTWYEDSYYNEDKNFKPQPGDLILFDPMIADSYYEAYPDHVNDPNNTMHDKDMYLSSHIGYVYDVDDEYVYTIEGNKSNQLKKCKYPLDFSGPGISSEQRINGYYRPNY